MLLLFWRGVWIICPAQEIVGGSMVKISQTEKMLYGDGLIPSFVPGIDRLTDLQDRRDIPLQKIPVVA